MVEKELQTAGAPFDQGVPVFRDAREAGSFMVGRLKDIMTETRVPGLTWLAMVEGRHYPAMAELCRTADGQDQTQVLGELVLTGLIAQGLFKPCDVSTAVSQFLGMANQTLFNEAMTRGAPNIGPRQRSGSLCRLVLRSLRHLNVTDE